MEHLSDRIRASDESAYEELFRTMYPELHRFAWRMSGDDDAAKDIVQDVFLRFWEARSRLDPGRSPRPLLYAMVRNAALNRIRQLRNRSWFPLETEPAVEADELRQVWAMTDRGASPDPDTAAAWAELNRRRHRIRSGDVRTWAAAAVLLVAMVSAWYWTRPSGETYMVLTGETRSVRLPDGSRVELNSESMLVLESGFGKRHRNLRLTGEAYFDVATDTIRPMRIATHNAQVTVIGTRFNLRSWPTDVTGSTLVMMEEGVVGFTGEAYPDADLLLTAGWQSQVTSIAPTPSTPVPVDPSLVGAWRAQGLYLRNEPMAVFVDELRRRYGIDVSIPDPAVANRRVDLALKGPVDLTGILRELSVSQGIGFREPEPGRVVLFVLERNGIRPPSLNR